MYTELIEFMQEEFRTTGNIPLHAPSFGEQEKRYICETIDSTYVSSIGQFVTRFESEIAAFTASPGAVATVNGTAALHAALTIAEVKANDLVLTQPLTFVATCNAIRYCGADPVFIDIDLATLGLSPAAVREWLDEHAFIDNDGQCRLHSNGRAIKACLPMHTFGHPVDLDGLIAVCDQWGIALIEDAAEALGSYYQDRHVGTFGDLGTLSFNGNKIITTGGGGMILMPSESEQRIRHLVTTAKVSHPYEFFHDALGFNYRMPNLNAALGCAQLESLPDFLESKRALALRYEKYFEGSHLTFVKEPPGCRSNYWLNAVICEDPADRDRLLEETNSRGILTRPVWSLMTRLPMYCDSLRGPLPNAEWLEQRLINLPSSPGGSKSR
jgi:aminotransferase in exopolysaccharide biosynthesis